jgi:hypothetical protein
MEYEKSMQAYAEPMEATERVSPLDEMRQEIKYLSARLQELEARLQPVLLGDIPANVADANVKMMTVGPGPSPLREVRMDLSNEVRRLGQLIERIDL